MKFLPFVFVFAIFALSPSLISAQSYICLTGPASFLCYDSLSSCQTACDPDSSCQASNCVPGSTPPNPSGPGGATPSGPGGATPSGPGGVTPSGAGATIDLPNPLGSTSDIPSIIERIVRFLRDIAAPIVAGMVIYGAYQILFAGGDPEKFATGRRTILYAALGYAIIWIGWGVASLIRSILSG